MNTVPLGEQLLLLVDEKDMFSGKYATRKECHTGQGLHHRAFLTLLFNKNNEVLVQKRKHSLWDTYWDISATSHVLHFKDGHETYEEAAARTLLSELGINKSLKLENKGGFNYFKRYKDFCENEYCAVLIGKYDGEVKPNESILYSYKWMPYNEFVDDVIRHKNEYTPWAYHTVMLLQRGE